MREVNYFVNTLGSRGFQSYADSNFGMLENSISLYGYPSKIMEIITGRVRDHLQNKDIQLEVIHNFLDNSIEGLRIPGLSAGVINFPGYTSGVYHVYNMFENEYLKLTKAQLNEAYKYFKEALAIHDDWEKIYISETDFNALNNLTDDTAEKLIGSKTLPKTGSCTDRFFGAATINGPFDYIQNITEGISKRYFIKGRPGTGKSTFLKKIASNAADNGFDVEVYHCSFDPDSLDLIVIRELDLCLFDSTSPHEYFPSRESDEIIDIYQTAVKAGTDEAYAKEISDLAANYRDTVQHATKYLILAQQSYQKVQNDSLAKINSASLDKTVTEIVSRLTD